MRSGRDRGVGRICLQLLCVDALVRILASPGNLRAVHCPASGVKDPRVAGIGQWFNYRVNPAVFGGVWAKYAQS